MSTDYDCWKVEEEAVSVESVIANLGANAQTAKNLLMELIPVLETQISTLECVKMKKGQSSNCVITAPHKRNPQTLEKLRYLFEI
jgi:5'-methylthioadenosine phosphorylase